MENKTELKLYAHISIKNGAYIAGTTVDLSFMTHWNILTDEEIKKNVISYANAYNTNPLIDTKLEVVKLYTETETTSIVKTKKTREINLN